MKKILLLIALLLFLNACDTTSPSDDDDSNLIEIVDVTNPATGQTWMDRNLGASRAATSPIDAQAYGDLYQWGRLADGHEKRNSSTTSTLSNSDQPGHGDFILTSEIPNDWRSPQNDNLWQGVDGINNPCPEGYSLPTAAEWEVERQSWSSNDSNGAYDSPLKLPVAGSRRNPNDGYLGISGSYWSSTVSVSIVSAVQVQSFEPSYADIYGSSRSSGYSVRCIKD